MLSNKVLKTIKSAIYCKTFIFRGTSVFVDFVVWLTAYPRNQLSMNITFISYVKFLIFISKTHHILLMSGQLLSLLSLFMVVNIFCLFEMSFPGQFCMVIPALGFSECNACESVSSNNKAI